MARSSDAALPASDDVAPAETVEAPAAAPALPHGMVEGSTDANVWGWALDPANPHVPVSVELWDSEQLVVRLRADTYRPDIEVGGKPGLSCGFNLPIPQHLLTSPRHVLHVRIAGQAEDLQNSPLIVQADRPPLSWEDFQALLPRVEAAAEAATSAAALRDLLGPVMGTLGALLPRYLAVAERNGEAPVEAMLDLAFSYSDRIGELVQEFTRRYPRIVLPEHDMPEVSVIIPVYGKFAYTYQCLASIAKALPRASIEVIVVDDCSPDETIFTASVVGGGIRYLRAPRNGGFIASCNLGAAAARGAQLLFLNNDTEVQEGWVDALLDTFREMPEAGLVGSKLLFPDGRVQEAGGIIWRLGDGWNYGRNAEASDPRISYLREVDYVSGAAIMVPKALFEGLGGFDTHYTPAYYEDTDLAFRIRAAGKRVYYQPRSAVVHHEGVTSGTDVKGTGAKRYQLVNGRKFFDRWRGVLASHRLNGQEPELEKERQVRRRILFIDETTPTPQEDAGSVAALSHMRAMQRLGAKVTFVPADNMAHLGAITEHLQGVGIEVLHAPWYWSAEEVVRKRGAEFDAVYLHRFVNAFKYAGVMRAAMPHAKLIYSVADLHHLRLEREAAVTASPEIAEKAAAVKAREIAALAAVDQVIVHSAHEGAYLADLVAPERLNVIPWVVPTAPPKTGFAERRDVVFLGGYRHPPNVDAVNFFVGEVMPILRQLVPGIGLRIAGSHMPDSFHDLAAADVVLDGFIPDLDSYFADVRLMVAPLRYGAGVKGKVLDSLARGLPCVATSVAAEGMGLADGVEIAIADSPRAIAEAIAWLYQDEDAWTRLQQGGLGYIERNCSEAAITALFGQMFARLDAS
jgi:GT2 family glycosyltransferase/glycosyltransferase involved in cell wall biosynthesis